MVPTTTTFSARNRGFPRPRGDGPAIKAQPGSFELVSPPTRGWSRHQGTARLFRAGFPAHAGMVPTTPMRWPAYSRFPRPRGDGPLQPGGMVGPPGVSPPTRGWSHFISPFLADDPGFPAHAGMVPGRRPHGTRALWFPRPRGDGPEWFKWPEDADAVSPPTRGWSHFLPAIHHVIRGFPAHAGMG